MVAPTLTQIRKLPKADLHSHIDGSIPPRELFEIARRNHRKIRDARGQIIDSAGSLVRHMAGSDFKGLLDQIVDRFHPITNLMQTTAILHEVGVAYVSELALHHVTYAEGRFAPQYHTREGLGLGEVVRAMADGLAEGEERYGVKVNLIVAIGREVDGGEGLLVSRAAVRSGTAVALDVGGPERGNPPEKFAAAFEFAARNGLRVTVHAGEGAGSPRQNLRNIRTAITVLGAKRLGHAIDLSKDRSLVQLVLAREVAIEMNPVSNLVLNLIRSIDDLKIRDLLTEGVCLTVNTDDPALWPGGYLDEVLYATCTSCGFAIPELDTLLTNSFRSAFAPRSERDALLEDYGRVSRRVL